MKIFTPKTLLLLSCAIPICAQADWITVEEKDPFTDKVVATGGYVDQHRVAKAVLECSKGGKVALNFKMKNRLFEYFGIPETLVRIDKNPVIKDTLSLESAAGLIAFLPPNQGGKDGGKAFNAYSNMIKQMKAGYTYNLRVTNKETGQSETLSLNLKGFTSAYNKYAKYCKSL